MSKKPAFTILLKTNSVILIVCLTIELIALLTGIVFNFIYPGSKNISMENLFQLVLFTIFTFVLLYLNNLFKKRLNKGK